MTYLRAVGLNWKSVGVFILFFTVHGTDTQHEHRTLSGEGDCACLLAALLAGWLASLLIVYSCLSVCLCFCDRFSLYVKGPRAALC